MKKNHNRRFTRLSHKRILIIDLQQKNITIFSTASNITNNTVRVYKNKLVHLSPLNANIVCIRVCIPRNSEVFPLPYKCQDDRYINMYNVKHSLTTSELFFLQKATMCCHAFPCAAISIPVSLILVLVHFSRRFINSKNNFTTCLNPLSLDRVISLLPKSTVQAIPWMLNTVFLNLLPRSHLSPCWNCALISLLLKKPPLSQ